MICRALVRKVRLGTRLGTEGGTRQTPTGYGWAVPLRLLLAAYRGADSIVLMLMFRGACFVGRVARVARVGL
jgi:hypothetical protein